MSGLEVVGLVAGIVSAFSSAASLYRDWKNGKKERKRQSANDRMDELVKSSGPKVQQEYDNDFRRLGRRFAKGDDVGRTSLLEQLVTLQQTVITLLSNGQAGKVISAVIHPSHDKIYNTSESVQRSSLLALGQLYQRLCTAAPIRNIGNRTSTAENKSANCDQKLKWRNSGGSDWYDCVSCGFSKYVHERDVKTVDTRVGSHSTCRSYWYKKFHFKRDDSSNEWRCPLCLDQSHQDWLKLRDHLESRHTYSEFFGNGCESPNSLTTHHCGKLVQ